MRIACLIPKTTGTRSEYAILFAFPLHKWLHERASMLRKLPIVFMTHTIWQNEDLLGIQAVTAVRTVNHEELLSCERKLLSYVISYIDPFCKLLRTRL